MALRSDDAGGEDCELEEYLFDDDDLLGNAITSPKAKGLVPHCHSPESLDRRIDGLIRETASLMGLSEPVVGFALFLLPNDGYAAPTE